LVDRAWELQHNIEARQKRIGKGKYGRVLKMARNPTNEEYGKTSKITGLFFYYQHKLHLGLGNYLD